MFAPGDGAKVFRADSREAGNFVFGKRFLSGLDGDHFLPSFMILANVRTPGNQIEAKPLTILRAIFLPLPAGGGLARLETANNWKEKR